MSKKFSQWSMVTILFLICVSGAPKAAPTAFLEQGKKQPPSPDVGSFTVAGRTQCAPGRKGTLAPVPLHPVVEVKAAPGDKVKKEQVLIKIDDDEPQADVRNKKALADGAKIILDEAKRYLAKVEKSYSEGAVPEASYYAALRDSLKALHDEKACVAAWESAKAELEHYEVVAPIDGIVSWIEVYPGMVSRPGTTVWGEILDLSEIDVRCEVSVEQADTIKVGQTVSVVRQAAKNATPIMGKVSYVGIVVDPRTSMVPILIRVPNADYTMRCNEAVHATFGKGK
ncbi:MAG TPA: efflux RND transporter periplasmic adaptor subunit [Gemmataceae bacterium]|nr:efflux RND transporter periplasmic adaptor subunit [Gemmataceae bacterium]